MFALTICFDTKAFSQIPYLRAFRKNRSGAKRNGVDLQVPIEDGDLFVLIGAILNENSTISFYPSGKTDLSPADRKNFDSRVFFIREYLEIRSRVISAETLGLNGGRFGIDQDPERLLGNAQGIEDTASRD